jgi:hypothetical protein
MGFEEKQNVSYDWFDESKVGIKSSSDTIKRVKTETGNPDIFYAKPVWKGMEFPLYTVELFPSADAVPAVSDIRVTLCPSPARKVYLSSFLDSLNYASAVQWSKVSASAPSLLNTSTGELNSYEFNSGSTNTYRYERFSECGSSSSVAKAYIHVPRTRIPRRQDTVLICVSRIDVVNINSIFGLELGIVSWKYDATVNHDATVDNNVVIAISPSQHAGGLFFDVKTAYQQTQGNAAYDATYRNVTGKAFVFEYNSTSSCTPSTAKIVIVAYE